MVLGVELRSRVSEAHHAGPPRDREGEEPIVRRSTCPRPPAPIAQQAAAPVGTAAARRLSRHETVTLPAGAGATPSPARTHVLPVARSPRRTDGRRAAARSAGRRA